MMKHDSLPSSSSCRENSNHKKFHAKSIGCMSGIIHLVSGHRNRRKFLTFGKKHEIDEIPAPETPNSSAALIQHSQQVVEGDDKRKERKNTTTLHFRRLSCDDVVPRSPTLPAEIRRTNSVSSPAESFPRTPPALVARLMGLEEAPPSKPLMPPESTADKRRQLLGALEKCDEDLKALKKIIDTVRSAEGLRSSAMLFKSPDGDDHRMKRFSGGKWSESNTEQPSPVSVLEELSTGSVSPLKKYYSHSKPQTYNRGGGIGAQGHNQKQQQMMIRKKPGEEEEYMNPTSRFEKITSTSSEIASPPWSSKAMRDSVEEVCRDITWGQRRELGRIGLSLQDHICRDLIHEFVIELITTSTSTSTYHHHHMPPYYHHHHPQFHSLPFEACKRRLCF
ncbi:hypothetical protein FNV43_RR15342 [Rhamnella rubrinervis]|uniref:DUF3741 domain-containing protein n=1 Tax=Rhamnella rubrinervis TaxID=2594499 RepID=A0A8K0E6D1_9ROSA|nr:hypothetical protein FNV43_RR15342 [Rhamnella rubrinervis]